MKKMLGMGDGCELPATAVYWLSDGPQPGIVLVELVDAHGRPHQLVDKTASFGGELLPTSNYACATTIQCTIEDIDDGIATVNTWWLSGGPDNVPFVFDVRLDTLGPTDRLRCRAFARRLMYVALPAEWVLVRTIVTDV